MKKKLFLTLAATCVLPMSAWASHVVTGQVVDADSGEPLIGAIVTSSAGGAGVQTDADGRFSITLPDNVTAVKVSYVGMNPKIVTASGQSLVVKLESQHQQLDEVVVTALGVKRERKALGYAVQDLKADDLNTNGTADLANAIQGRVSGVDIKPSSGMPGASTNIVIRGARSFEGSNQPLYVVDGMPISSESDFRNTSNDVIKGTNYSQRSIDINPEDIESINVLKGQAAAALYGIRASNGVIVITTKRGSAEKGKPRVSISSNFSSDLVSRPFEHQTEYAQGAYGKFSPASSMTWGPKISELPNDPTYGGNVANSYTNNGADLHQGQYYNPVYAKAGLSGWVTPQVYNNVSDYFNTGFTENTTFNISQNVGQANYSFSLSNTHQDGVVPSTGMDRWGARGLVDWKLNDQWKTGFSFNYNSTKINSAPIGNSGILNVVYGAPAEFNLKGVPYNVPGDPTQQISYRSLSFNNPYWWSANNSYLQHTNRGFGNVYLEFRPNLGWGDNYNLVFREQAGIDMYTNDNTEIAEVGSAQDTGGSILNQGVTNNTFNNLLTANFTGRFSDDWSLDVTLGNEINHQGQRSWSYQGTGFNMYGLPTISNAKVYSSAEYSEQERLVGLFGSANLAWRDMVYLTVTGRNDWLSSMPRGARSFFYPSVSASWLFTELPALKGNSVLSNGKVRLSYAEVGEAGGYRSNFFYMPAYGGGMYGSYPVQYPFNGIVGLAPYWKKYDPDLKPQTTKNIETGVELGFFNNRLRVDYTYSYQNVKDQIMSVPQDGASGYQEMITNGGQIVTNSHEVNVNATLYQNKDWQVDLGANFTRVHNYVKKLADGVESIMLGGFVEPQVRAEVGTTYPIIYGIGYERDPQGNLILEQDGTDANGNPQYLPVATANSINLGSCSPNFTMGFNLNVRYKRVSLATTWSWQNGGRIYEGTYYTMNYFGATKETAEARDRGYVPISGVVANADGSYTHVSGTADPFDYYTTIGNISEAAIYDADFLKMRDLTVTYQLPKIGKFDISVFGFARNILVWSKLPSGDPEASIGNSNIGGYFERFSMPQTKSFGGGFKVSF